MLLDTENIAKEVATSDFGVAAKIVKDISQILSKVAENAAEITPGERHCYASAGNKLMLAGIYIGRAGENSNKQGQKQKYIQGISQDSIVPKIFMQGGERQFMETLAIELDARAETLSSGASYSLHYGVQYIREANQTLVSFIKKPL